MNTLEAALALAAESIPGFPCLYGKKEPATRRGFYDATTNPATLKRWFGGGFKYNLAVRTGQVSRVWVLDVDDPAALETIDPLPITRQSRSSRGFHFWFKTTAIPIPSSAGRVAVGIDVKAENGYVIVPPSLHPDGVHYEWTDNSPIAEAPSWLLVRARKLTPVAEQPTRPDALRVVGRPGAYGAAALRSEISILINSPKGWRNNQLNKTAFNLSQLVAIGELDAHAVEAALIDAATVIGLVAEDGIRQTIATIRSGAKAGLANPRNHGGRS